MKALVTGGGGFLGSAICRLLLDEGHIPVALGRSRYPHLERLGVGTVQADIRDAEELRRAFRGMDVVFHTAAIAAIWGPKQLFESVNILGTQNVIAACRACGVPGLVYTSSPSVILGPDSCCGVNESHPYPAHYLAHYPRTKARAERLVLAANGPNLATVALRPHLIFGPGDPHLIPRIAARARAGRLVQVGDGRNLVDVTYIANAARAHLLAANTLHSTSRCAGRAYFISQGDPVRLWPWLNELLIALDCPPIRRSISYRKAYLLGSAFEGLFRFAGVKREPPMTRFLALQLSQSHYFDISAAKEQIGYEAKVTTEEGVRNLICSLLASRS